MQEKRSEKSLRNSDRDNVPAVEPDGPESNAAIGNRLRWSRLALGFKQQVDICRKISDDPDFTASWNNWEKGRTRPGVDNAILLVKLFGLTLDWIFLGDDRRLPRELADEIDRIRRAEQSGSQPARFRMPRIRS
jgi:transcriptional regulator with XRE-family HTH domain